MSVSSGSVRSLESIYSDGCPVSPSLLYEQRAMLYETRQKQRHRKAVTAYRPYKSRSSIGEASLCLVHGENQGHEMARLAASQRIEFHRSHTYRLRDKVSHLAMISIAM